MSVCTQAHEVHSAFAYYIYVYAYYNVHTVVFLLNDTLSRKLSSIGRYSETTPLRPNPQYKLTSRILNNAMT